jgi:anti-sigma factor RsiW
MTADEARDLFSEAFEGDLDEAQQEAFDAALAADEELRLEYEEFVDTFALVSKMGEPESIEVPNLLPKIQDRIRRRSRGRYYRDQFSRRAGPGWMMPLVAAVAVLLILGAAVYALQTAVVLETTAEHGSE